MPGPHGEGAAGTAPRGVRLFFAVPLPDELAAALEPAARRLQAAGWRAVAAAQRHLTVRFLGDRPPEEVSGLLAGAARALGGVAPFALELRGLGAFPHARRPDVAFAACGSGRPGFARLAAAVHALPPPADPGHAEPHVTLARRPARLSPPAAAAGWAECAAACGEAPWGVLAVRQVVLLRSDLGSGPPRYHPLGAVALGGLAAPRAAGLP